MPPPSPDSTGKDRSAFAERVATARAWSRKASESNTFLSHVAAGVAGAVLTLIVGALFGLFAAGNEGGEQLAPDVAKRLAALEQSLRQRAAPPAGDVAAKLAAAEARLKSLEEQARSVATLGDAQSEARRRRQGAGGPLQHRRSLPIAWRRSRRRWPPRPPAILGAGAAGRRAGRQAGRA